MRNIYEFIVGTREQKKPLAKRAVVRTILQWLLKK